MKWKNLNLGERVQGIHTGRMDRDQWLSLRMSMGTLGGSDIGVVCGRSKYKSNVALFWEKVGLKERTFTGSRATLRGQLMEYPIVGNLWQYHDGNDKDSVVRNEALGNKVREFRKINYLIRNPRYPGLHANLDGHIVYTPNYDGKGVLEIKTITSRVAEQYEIGFPPTYLYQVQAYLMITGYEYAELAVYIIDKDELVIYPMYAKPNFQAMIWEKCQDFLQRVKEARMAIKGLKKKLEIEQTVSQIEPEPIPSTVLEEFYSERHKMLEDKVVIEHTPREIVEAALAYLEYKDAARVAEEKSLEAKIKVQKFMRDNGAKRATWPNGYIGWKSRLVIKNKGK
jgi:hypothetical protein